MSTLMLVVLGSTRGTNMQAIIDAISSSEIDASIEMVISNRKQAFILQRAEDNNIAHKFIRAKDKTREQYDKLLISEINSHNPDLILLIRSSTVRIIVIIFSLPTVLAAIDTFGGMQFEASTLDVSRPRGIKPDGAKITPFA